MADPSSSARALPNAKYAYLDSPVLQIVVGTSPFMKSFFVHEALICESSNFIRSALSGPWKESEDRTIPLPEDDPDVFGLYVRWLYTEKLFVIDTKPDSKASDTEYTSLAKLYVFCEKILDDKPKATILRAMSQRAKLHKHDALDSPTLDAIRIIYNGTPEGDEARRFFVTLYTDNVTHITQDEEAAKNMPADFFRELSRSLLQRRPLPGDHERLANDSKVWKEKVRRMELEIQVLKRDMYDKDTFDITPPRVRIFSRPVGESP